MGGPPGNSVHFNRQSRAWLSSVSFLLTLVANMHASRWSAPLFACRDTCGSTRESGMPRQHHAESDGARETPECFDFLDDCLALEQEYGAGMSGRLPVHGTGLEGSKTEPFALLNHTAAVFDQEVGRRQSAFACYHILSPAVDVEWVNDNGHIANVHWWRCVSSADVDACFHVARGSCGLCAVRHVARGRYPRLD